MLLPDSDTTLNQREKHSSVARRPISMLPLMKSSPAVSADGMLMSDDDEVWLMEQDTMNDQPLLDEALSSKDKDLWLKAIKCELDSLNANDVWDVVVAPPNVKVLGCKFVLKIKRNLDGSIAKYKARVVAKGYTQQFGVDYTTPLHLSLQ